MKSIQTKFILLILAAVLLSSAIVGGAGMLHAQRVVDADAAQIMNLLCSEQAGAIDALLSRVEQSVSALSSFSMDQLDDIDALKTDPAYLDAYTKTLQSVFITAANNTDGAVAVYARFNPDFAPPTSGLFWSKSSRSGAFEELTPTDFSRYSPSDLEHVGWYYIPAKTGKPTWMTPYVNQNINVRMISYVIPLYGNGEILGVVGMDIDFDLITDVVSKMHAYQTGYAFLADESGNIMYHDGLAFGISMGNADKSLIPVVSELENASSGNTLFPYLWKGESTQMAFRSLSNGMRLVLTAPTREIDEAKNSLLVQITMSTLGIAGIAVLMTILVSRRIVRPLKELNEAAQKIADGDLSISLEPKTKDEVGMLTTSFQQTAAHLQEYIGYINGLAYRDALTGVKNKTAYQEAVTRWEEQMRTGLPEFAVIVFDINGLKDVNDHLGHDFGDILITDACKLICRVFYRSPVYRIGGDEFVAILDGPDLERYSALLETFAQEMDRYNQSGRKEFQLSVARGIAIYDPYSDLLFSSVFKRADDAMYQNKALYKQTTEQQDESAQ